MAITNFNFPRVTVNQEFTGAGTATDAALPVCVIGPEYAVKTYAKYGQQLLIGEFGGSYTDIPYPGNTAGGQVNPSSVQLLVKDAHVQLFDSSTLTGAKFATIKSISGADVLNKVVCMRSTTVSGQGTQPVANVEVPVVLRSGNGYARDAAVVTNIAAGDILVLNSVEYVISDIERQDNRYSVLVLNKALPAAITNAAAVVERIYDTTIEATSATTETLTCPSTAKVSIVNSQGQSVENCTISKGTLYAQYSVRVLKHVNMLGSVGAGAGMMQALNDIFQGLDNNNPLGQGVYAACTTAGDTIVYFTAVAHDTVEAYAQAMDFIDGKDTCYNCVILSQDPAVIKTCLEFANQQSDAQMPNPKIIWAGMSNPDAVTLAEIIDYTIAPAGTSITVIDAAKVSGVVVGDYIKWLSDTDIYGAPVYSQVYITNVEGATLGFAAADLSTMTGSVSIVRKNYSKLQLVNHIIQNKYVADRRAAVVYADDAVFGGQVVPGYIAAACAAGMRASEQPHRPLSNMPYGSLMVLQTHGLSLSHLKMLGANGIWLIGNNAAGIAINRRQVTSAAANDLNYDEQSLTTNVDSITQVIKHAGQNLVGNSNISPMLIQTLANQLHAMLSAFTSYVETAVVGPQLLQAQLVSIEQDTVNLDTVYADLQIQPPKPFNRLHIRVRVV